MNTISWFDNETKLVDATSDQDVVRLFEQLSSQPVSDCIKALIEKYDVVTRPTDIELSHLFFILSEIQLLNSKVRDFCLDTANYIALDEESRVQNFDINGELEKVKALANVCLPARG